MNLSNVTSAALAATFAIAFLPVTSFAGSESPMQSVPLPEYASQNGAVIPKPSDVSNVYAGKSTQNRAPNGVVKVEHPDEQDPQQSAGSKVTNAAPHQASSGHVPSPKVTRYKWGSHSLHASANHK